MTATIHITVPGEPIARPRQRVGVLHGHARTFTDTKHPVHAYKAAIRLAWQASGGLLSDGPVVMRIDAVFPRPKAKVWKTKLMPSYPHTSKPDFDNVAKAVLDALNGLGFRDDSQVYQCTVTKRVASGDEQPRTEIEITTPASPAAE